MTQFLDSFIFGLVLYVITIVLTKVIRSYIRLNQKVATFLPVGIFIVLFLVAIFTEPGKEIRSKFAFFDKTRTWNDYGTLTIARQCLVLGSISSPENALTFNVDLEKLSKQKRDLFFCCRDKVRSNISQDEYFKRNGDDGNIVLSAIYDCKK